MKPVLMLILLPFFALGMKKNKKEKRRSLTLRKHKLEKLPEKMTMKSQMGFLTTKICELSRKFDTFSESLKKLEEGQKTNINEIQSIHETLQLMVASLKIMSENYLSNEFEANTPLSFSTYSSPSSTATSSDEEKQVFRIPVRPAPPVNIKMLQS